MPHGPIFDRYVMVDWSAARPPNRGRDSIWVAVRDAAGMPTRHRPPTTARPRLSPPASGRLVNPPSQGDAMAVLADAVGSSGRVLVGIDVCLGPPRRWTDLVLPGPAPAWRRLWAWCAEAFDPTLTDKWAPVARLNRACGEAPGPLWGGPDCPSKPAGLPDDLSEWRATEVAAHAAGLRPTSFWQAAYAGAVGLQSLTAMGCLERWRRTEPRLRIWPFDPIDPRSPGGDTVVVAEVYPAMHPEPDVHHVRDARQVSGSVTALAEADADGRLAHWLTSVPDDPAVVTEEGWTLGVPGGAPVSGGGS